MKAFYELPEIVDVAEALEEKRREREECGCNKR